MNPLLKFRTFAALIVLVAATMSATPSFGEGGSIDFNRDIRPILSNKCFFCHGPDESERQAGLRLDTAEGAVEDRGGYAAVVPGDPDASELVYRVETDDALDLMPPPETNKPLTANEKELLRRWVDQGGDYATHWAYVQPTLPGVPEPAGGEPAFNPIDRFVAARRDAEGLAPAPEADPAAIVRRVTLDLTGLPPEPEEIDAFRADDAPDAFGRLVDRLLASPSYGEHQARPWLDLARYADSAGYADDPSRTIWAYRDYVIDRFNENIPFDEFTIEQLAGDLLADPEPEQLIATAFHRNTMTNSEGGTDDEEFRNAAIVDRVNTTMTVWMGTSMACAQCHTHKYDPITQVDYFRLFAVLNNTADADLRDESPTLPLFSEAQQEARERLQEQITDLETSLSPGRPGLDEMIAEWEDTLDLEPSWTPLESVGSVGDEVPTFETGAEPIVALRIEFGGPESLPVERVGVSVVAESEANGRDRQRPGRFLRLTLPGEDRILSLAEVQVFDGPDNVAIGASASQSSIAFEGTPDRAIDGNTDGHFDAASTTHTAPSESPWWELDLVNNRFVDRVVLWNRSDEGVDDRIGGLHVALLDENRSILWEQVIDATPRPSLELSTPSGNVVALASVTVHSGDESRPLVKGGQAPADRPIRSETDAIIARPVAPIEAGAGASLAVRLTTPEAVAPEADVRLSALYRPEEAMALDLPGSIRAILRKPTEERTPAEIESIAHEFINRGPALASERAQLESAREALDAIEPTTTVPILREREQERRATHVQIRGDFQALGEAVTPGLPSAFRDDRGADEPGRLELARWLVDERNPLTARVVANRLWEQFFGTGLVVTSEEFGSQGEPPSHPELLDWLACELVDSGWDLKHVVRLIVTSRTYRQSSKVTPEDLERDPDNRFLARGPRRRLSAEAVRDQALAVSGLLSRTLHGPPVNPPRPETGLNAAFGSAIDQPTSTGADRYRRALYTEWRRSNPYPSMTTFDAPNREVCTVRRDRTNTPLQALVTLNDPVYVEAAQALARRLIAESAGGTAERASHGFRLCLGRMPTEREVGAMVELFEDASRSFRGDHEAALALATEPLGPLPEGVDAGEAAAWTVVSNVLMNLDEFFLKP